MEKVNAGIFTFFMGNIDQKTVDMHSKVVNKRNPSNYPHFHINTQFNHGASMDLVWSMNGQPVSTFRGQNVAKRFDFDVIMFLDIDAIPVDNFGLDYYIHRAAEGALIGNAQRSNHIQNNQHIFAAPSVVSMSVDTYATIGFPSAIPTGRGDVGEEYTYAAEKAGNVPVTLTMPLGYDEAPAECPFWPLKDGQPVYGRGTTFGLNDNSPMFWHQFQSFHPGQQDKYRAKLESILTEVTITPII
jgi:hypothetical protein